MRPDISTLDGRCRARAMLAATLLRTSTDADLFRRCRQRHIAKPATGLTAAAALAFLAIPEPIPARVPTRARRAAL